MKYNIIKDRTYGYLRADPIPSQEDVNKYYVEEFYSTSYNAFNDSAIEIKEEEKNFFEAQYEDMVEVFERYFKTLQGLSMFEVGFGFGQALSYFDKKGIEVCGLEPSPEGVKFAQQKGLNVFCNSIEDFKFESIRKVDVVLLMNVLEHLREPAKTLMTIKNKLLKRNGLVVIDVPNEFNDFQCVANDEYALNEWWVVPPNHINYFSAKSLEFLLEKCGYTVFYKKSSFPMELFLLMGDVYVGDSVLGKICHDKRTKFEYLMRKYNKKEKLNKLYELLAEIDIGRQVTIYAYPCE